MSCNKEAFTKVNIKLLDENGELAEELTLPHVVPSPRVVFHNGVCYELHQEANVFKAVPFYYICQKGTALCDTKGKIIK